MKIWVALLQFFITPLLSYGFTQETPKSENQQAQAPQKAAPPSP
jgi:hypothetical protein